MVDAAPKVDHTNHANKLVAKGLMATRGILAVAMLAGAAGLGGSAPVRASQTVEGDESLTGCSVESYTTLESQSCPIGRCYDIVDNSSPATQTFTESTVEGGNLTCYYLVCPGSCP